MTKRPPTIELAALLERYDAFMLDAYGVLVSSERALRGAAAFVDRLREADKRFVVVSNDASRLPSTCARRYRSLGIDLDAEQIITSGSLIGEHFRRHGLRGKACAVLGPEDSVAYVRDAGGHIVEAGDERAEVVVIGDDSGYPFLPTIENTLDAILARCDRGNSVHLVLPNPDLVYPKGEGRIGLASGTVAMMIESALRLRLAEAAPTFARLGKPFAPMFEAGLRHLGDPPRDCVVMLGDQLTTDVEGAKNVGIDSVLVGTGLTSLQRSFDEEPRPTWLLEGL